VGPILLPLKSKSIHKVGASWTAGLGKGLRQRRLYVH